MASETFLMPSIRAAILMGTFFFRERFKVSLKDFLIILCMVLLIFFSDQKKFCRSWTHSKYETITPPEFARISGIINTPFSFKISSASLAVGPLAPSASILHFILYAFFSVICPHKADGTRISHLSSRSSSGEIISPSG